MEEYVDTNDRVMRKIIIVFNICIAVLQIQGMQQTVRIGAQAGWGSLSTMKGTLFHTGKKAFPVIMLQGSRYTVDKQTDLLIHFDTAIEDAAHHYTVNPGAIRLSKRFLAMGTGAGIFTHDGRGIKLTPGSNSFFSRGNTGGSFSIEFWLNPTYASDNEEIFSFRSSKKNRNGKIIPQKLTCYIEGRKLKWSFKNFFFNPKEFTSTTTLEGEDALIPEEWHHHMLVFHGSSGLMEYYIDHKLEGITYATASGTDDNAPLVPIIGSVTSGELHIGKTFTGFMDELRIEKKAVAAPVLSRFQGADGSITTAILDMGRGDSRLQKITIDASVPADSAVRSYYRVYSSFKQTLGSSVQWEPFISGTFIKAMNTGRFFEIKLHLYADGSGTLSPEIHSINITFDRNLPPLAPLSIKAIPGDHRVTLTWNDIGETDIQGYLIYYGTETGVYFGTDAAEGPSPIKVSQTTVTLHGLDNGKLYYFAVAAYDKAGITSPGALSEEISARPGELANREN